MVTTKIQICFLTFGSNKGFSHGQCRSFYNGMVYLLICALLLCKIAFVLFVEISVRSFCKRTFRDGRGKHIFSPLIILWGSLDAEIMPRIWWRDCYQVLKGGLNLHLSNLSCSLLSTVGARGWKRADGTSFNQASNFQQEERIIQDLCLGEVF